MIQSADEKVKMSFDELNLDDQVTCLLTGPELLGLMKRNA